MSHHSGQKRSRILQDPLEVHSFSPVFLFIATQPRETEMQKDVSIFSFSCEFIK